jgi:hypothetical protein
MRATACLAAAMLALGAAMVQAQNANTNASTTVAVTPLRGYGGEGRYGWGGYPWGGYDHASTFSEGFGRGLDAVIRAQGEYNLNTSAAAINVSLARQQEIENRKRWTQSYFEIRDLNRQGFEAETKRLRGTPEDWLRVAQAGKPKRLSPTELDIVTGAIHWPILLTARSYSGQRVELEKAFTDRAYHGVLEAETFLKVLQLTENLLSDLKTQVRDLPTGQYLAAKRFLESLAYEASQPAG